MKKNKNTHFVATYIDKKLHDQMLHQLEEEELDKAKLIRKALKLYIRFYGKGE